MLTKRLIQFKHNKQRLLSSNNKRNLLTYSLLINSLLLHSTASASDILSLEQITQLIDKKTNQSLARNNLFANGNPGGAGGFGGGAGGAGGAGRCVEWNQRWHWR